MNMIEISKDLNSERHWRVTATAADGTLYDFENMLTRKQAERVARIYGKEVFGGEFTVTRDE